MAKFSITVSNLLTFRTILRHVREERGERGEGRGCVMVEGARREDVIGGVD